MISKNIRIQILYELVSAISEKVGQISSHKELESKPHLRRNNRIKSIHSSLKIEANSLSLSEVREVIDGHLVLGDQKEIQEVKNAYKAYEEIEKASTLISALGENSSTQQYAAIVMNDIMRNVYFNEEYKSYLRTIMDEEKSKNKQHMAKNKKDIATKETKEDKENGTVTTTQVNIVNGKVVATEELDKAILDNFGKCPSMHYFEPQEEDY
mgnify:CR=1 FL=1